MSASSYNLVVAVYEGPATAREVFNILQGLEKEKALDLKEAAVFTRAPNGKVHMDNLGYVGSGKGGVLGLVVGAVVASAPLAGLVVGGLIGFSRSGDRRKLKTMLGDELDGSQSALAVVIKQADWTAVAKATEQYPGEILLSDISDEALSTLEGLSQDEDLDEATRTTIAFD